MPEISHIAKFSPADTRSRILDDLACPACGYPYPADEHSQIAEHQVRFFCDGCGAFVTVTLNAEQSATLDRWSASALASTADPGASSSAAIDDAQPRGTPGEKSGIAPRYDHAMPRDRRDEQPSISVPPSD